MGRRGPPKTPAAILKSRKTFRKDRHSDDLDSQVAPGLPAVPPHLSPAAAAVWRDVGSKLAAKGLVCDLDAQALELLVGSYCGMREAAEQLGNEDLVNLVGEAGVPVANPLVGIVSKQVATLKWCLREFGMTPSARTGIKLKGDDKPVDPMAALLARK